jgi:oligopeptide/dipeptide ABC transporter ATP-binding protein
VSASADSQALLEVRGLVAGFATDHGILHAVDGISFDIRRGERFAVVGESGSGKSVTALSLLGLVDPPGFVRAERITFGGHDLTALSQRQLGRIRGREIALVMQDPLASLSPVFSVGEQIAETIRHHEGARRAVAMRRAIELLGRVGIADAAQRARSYPHELSGGMRQRVAIAIALSCGPSLLIADEPTTALDVTIQAQVLELLLELSEQRAMAVMLISHDLGVVAGFADSVAVMYAGRFVERGQTQSVFARPSHPYTEALLASQPRLAGTRGEVLEAIPGAPPVLYERPPGCAFLPRCARSRDRTQCQEADPVLRSIAAPDHREAACHFSGQPIGIVGSEAS